METQWPLVIFTLFVCLTCGTLGGMSILALKGQGRNLQMTALITSAVSLVVGGIGAFLHLEHWERIFNGFGHITSGITQELIGCVALAIVIVAWFVVLRGGKPVPKALAWATLAVAVLMMVATAHSYLIPEDFDYLRRGGRLTPLAATFAHLVKAFPVMKQTDDGTRLEKMKVARSFAKAVNAIADDLEARGVGDGFFLGVSHADNRVQADEASGMLSERFPGCRHGVFDLGPAFITQGGPGCLAIQAVDLGAYPDLDLD